MNPGANVDVEGGVRGLCGAGAYDEATTAALRAYGHEVFRFLCALQKSETDASDVFSVFSEDLWKSMKGFAWECSLRTWAYTLARRAAFRTRRKKRREGLGSPSAISQVVQEVRTDTLTYLRTETKSRIRALRDTLPEADRTLLMLRVDRGLEWDELARVLSAEDLDGPDLKREAARLRKRFQLVKDKLKGLAKREGIYPSQKDHG
jgi:RNA polymerase sigma-70 factor (ECF subfamily)